MADYYMYTISPRHGNQDSRRKIPFSSLENASAWGIVRAGVIEAGVSSIGRAGAAASQRVPSRRLPGPVTRLR